MEKKQVIRGHPLPREHRGRDISAYRKEAIIKGHSQTGECEGRDKLAHRMEASY